MIAGFLQNLEKYGKQLGYFAVWKSLDKNFHLLVWKKEIIFQIFSFDRHSDKNLF